MTAEQLRAMGRVLADIADEIETLYPIPANSLRNMAADLLGRRTMNGPCYCARFVIEVEPNVWVDEDDSAKCGSGAWHIPQDEGTDCDLGHDVAGQYHTHECVVPSS